MIVTLTPNPSLDRTLELPVLTYGAVNRATGRHVEPSGKGVNVSRALARNGIGSVAVLPLGGPDGDRLADLLAAEGVDQTRVPFGGDVRVNVSLVTTDGAVTKVNEPGPLVSEAEVSALLETCAAQAGKASWVVAAGTLPRGAPDDLYARACELAHRAGARFALDSSGEPLRRALAAGPDLLKPNLPELRELTGSSPATVGEVADAARGLRTRTGGAVLVSIGADGALLVDGTEAWWARPATTSVRSSVGAGDNLLAGYLASGTDDPAVRLREAVTWGTVAARSPGSLGDPVTDADRAAVDVLDATRAAAVPLSEDAELPGVEGRRVITAWEGK